MQNRLSEITGGNSAALFKVLSSDTRRAILRLLQSGPLSMRAIAGQLNLSRSALTRHIQDLKEAELISLDSAHQAKGLNRICRLQYERIHVLFEHRTGVKSQVEEREMPLGLYTRADVSRPCGMANDTGLIGAIDDPQTFLLPDRASARLLWLGHGYVEYVFPNRLPSDVVIQRLELAMEICSELALHRIDCPCDVTVWVNGVEIGTWTSFGGLGDGRGRLTPDWWWDTRTQFGMLKVWSVDQTGTVVDGSPISTRALPDLHIVPQEPITVRIGIKPDSQNTGSFILFGKTFGNYEQDLILRLHFAESAVDAR